MSEEIQELVGMHLTVEEWLAKFFQPISDVPRNGIVRLKSRK